MTKEGTSEEVDVIETEVMMLLPELEAEELEKVCELVPLTLLEAAKGKKHALLKLLFKHLMGLDVKEDGGFATYQLLHKHLVNKDVVKTWGTDGKVKIENGDKNVNLDKTLKKLRH